MMQISCPYCGARDETEFAYGGEAGVVRPSPEAQDADWARYLYFRDNTKGLQAERWRHARGCGQWFTAMRDTATHRFLGSYRLGESMPVVGEGTAR